MFSLALAAFLPLYLKWFCRSSAQTLLCVFMYSSISSSRSDMFRKSVSFSVCFSSRVAILSSFDIIWSNLLFMSFITRFPLFFSSAIV